MRDICERDHNLVTLPSEYFDVTSLNFEILEFHEAVAVDTFHAVQLFNDLLDIIIKIHLALKRENKFCQLRERNFQNFID